MRLKSKVALLIRVGAVAGYVVTAVPLARPARADTRSLTDHYPPSVQLEWNWRFSPDSQRVVFSADVDVDDHPELYSVAVSGGPPVRLNPTPVAGGAVQGFSVTPDSRYVVYLSDQEVDDQVELFRVPIAGGPTLKLNRSLTPGGDVQDFAIDPDNVRVVYVADGEIDGATELYSAPLGHGTPLKLNPSPANGGQVTSFQIDPIANRVVYSGDLEVKDRIELYSVPIIGGAAVKLSPPGTDHVWSFTLDPSIQVVVFMATGIAPQSAALYMNATGGGLLTALSVPQSAEQTVFGYQISPDGAHVVYCVMNRSTVFSPYNGDLYHVLIGGGPSTLLTPGTALGYGVRVGGFWITADSAQLIYAYKQNAAAAPKLISVTLAGANRMTLHDSATDGQLNDFHVSADRAWVAMEVSTPGQIRTIPASGGAATVIGIGQEVQFGPGIDRILYVSDAITGNHDLFSDQISGGDRRNLSHMRPGDEVLDVRVSPDGMWVAMQIGYQAGAAGWALRISDGAEAQSPYVFLPFIQR